MNAMRASVRGLVLLACLCSLGATSALAQAADTSKAKTILVVGDSISAEYGLAHDTGWVRLLRDRLAQKHLDYTVVNASISGDTTGGGRSRLTDLLQRTKPAVVVIELGGNDALRGLPLSETEGNLRSMATEARAAHAQVLLVGLELPPNFGKPYLARFSAVYPAVAKETHSAFIPSLFAGFSRDFSDFQADDIHPNTAAQPKLLDNIWAGLEPLLHS